MRLANVEGRAVLLTSDDPENLQGLDVERASAGKFGPSLAGVYDDWASFRSWADSVTETAPDTSFTRSQLECPSPAPRQVVAIGLNYGAHAAESGFAVPDTLPPTFTKFVSSLTGPDTEVRLPDGGHTDWEIELVVVMGRTTRDVTEQEAWDFVAGLTAGQDLSERITQLVGPVPQFSLGKSFPGFSPVGPWVVTPDAVPDKDDLALSCSIDGETVQDGRTKDLIFSVASLIAKLSRTITLYPGDLIFTGTPSGVGMGREPKRFLKHGERLDSHIEGIGELHQRFVETPTGSR